MEIMNKAYVISRHLQALRIRKNYPLRQSISLNRSSYVLEQTWLILRHEPWTDHRWEDPDTYIEYLKKRGNARLSGKLPAI